MVDNPWPGRQDREDDEREQHAFNIAVWKETHYAQALELASQIRELEREFENEFDRDFGEDFQSFFDITRGDINRFQRTGKTTA